MNPEETRQSAYQNIKANLDNLFSKGGIPNIKGFQKTIRDLKKRINLLETGTQFFATSLEDVAKAELAVARLNGQLQAYQERYNWIQAKLKENQ
ncbi:MAG: hypothetical protein IJ064_05545 [Bacteroidaceae bacterium]|nr:hypothetical protein [Bacteroidaceae bacterium]